MHPHMYAYMHIYEQNLYGVFSMKWHWVARNHWLYWRGRNTYVWMDLSEVLVCPCSQCIFPKGHETLPLSQFWNWNSKILGNTILAALCWPEIKLRSATIEISSHIAMEMELRPGWRQMSLLQSGGHNHQTRHRGFKAIQMARQGISGHG